jgi:F0F1-type ATP synthase membrane subunit b/b'
VKANISSRIDAIETPKFEAPTVESLKAEFTKAQAQVISEVEKAQVQAKEELAKLQASVEETVETVKGRFKKAA